MALLLNIINKLFPILLSFMKTPPASRVPSVVPSTSLPHNIASSSKYLLTCGRTMARPYIIFLYGLRGHGTLCPYYILYVFRTQCIASLQGLVYLSVLVCHFGIAYWLLIG